MLRFQNFNTLIQLVIDIVFRKEVLISTKTKEESKPAVTTEKEVEVVQSVTQSIKESQEVQKEVDKSAASLEDELLEIGGDALSQALADAISQLTTTDIEPEEVKPKKEEKKDKVEKESKKDKEKQKADEKQKSKDGIQELTDFQTGFGKIQKAGSSSMDLSNFDSLAEFSSEKKGSESGFQQTKGKSNDFNPNDRKSLENLFSSALSDLSKAFGTADIPSATEEDKKNKDDKKKKK